MKTISRSKARSQGLTRYFTGKPCLRLHIAPRKVSDRGCVTCNKNKRDKWLKDNPDRKRAYGRQWFKKRRMDVLQRLGLKCRCCGETRMEFLTLDHINGGGNEHRKTFGKNKGTPSGFYKWAATTPLNELKLILQVLCWNCNCAIGCWGYCPHQSEGLVCVGT